MAENFLDDFKLSLICKKVYFKLSHLISFYTWNVEIKHEKGYFFYSKSWKQSLTGLENMLYLAENFWLLRMFPDLKNYIYGLWLGSVAEGNTTFFFLGLIMLYVHLLELTKASGSCSTERIHEHALSWYTDSIH